MLFSEPTDDFYTGTTEDFFSMGGVCELSAQILPGEMQIAMQIAAPIWTIADIIDDAVIGDPFFVGIVAVMA